MIILKLKLKNMNFFFNKNKKNTKEAKRLMISRTKLKKILRLFKRITKSLKADEKNH
jgi:translation initiation factor 2 beta subunit (eIF-2beta)/eIF-5